MYHALKLSGVGAAHRTLTEYRRYSVAGSASMSQLLVVVKFGAGATESEDALHDPL